MSLKNPDGSPPRVRVVSALHLNASLLAVLLLAAPAGAQGDGFHSGSIAPGASWSHTFTQVNEAGHGYHCHPHPDMEGMVHVQPDSDGETATHGVDIVEGAGGDWGYSVTHLVIEVGDTVVWTNKGSVAHTVTEDAGGDHDHGEHDHGDGHDHAASDGNDAPGPAWAGVLLGIATVLTFAVLRRR